MSLFRTLGRSLGSGVVMILSDPDLREGVCDLGRRGYEHVSQWFDVDGDGDVDEDDIQYIYDYLMILGSLLGQAAAADGEISEVEEDEAADIIEYLVFSEEGILPPEALEASGWNKKELRQCTMAGFQCPLAMKKIARFAIESDLEEFFFQYACLVVNADKTIEQDERSFLDELARQLEISDIDRRRIERWNLQPEN